MIALVEPRGGTTTIVSAARGSVHVPLGFDPDVLWGALAQFYRRSYLPWIDATRRPPERRAERLAEVVALLEAGIKERPK